MSHSSWFLKSWPFRFVHPVTLVLSGLLGTALVTEALSFPKAEPQSMQWMQIRGAAGSDRLAQANPFTQPDNQPNQPINGAAVLLLATLGCAGLGATLTTIHNYQNRDRQLSHRQRPRPLQSFTPDKAFNPGKANPKLQRQLVRLLREDRQAADRLVKSAELKHPGHSADWYVEKVIYDLSRDRH
jgi:hypothetical protein